MSKMGQYVQETQEGQPEPMTPDPVYDEEWQELLKQDPDFTEWLDKINAQPF